MEHKLKKFSGKWRGKLVDTIDFIRQCIGELRGNDKKRGSKNSDLRGHSFASASVPGNNNRKKPGLSKLKSKIRRKQKVHDRGYTVDSQDRSKVGRFAKPVFLTLTLAAFLLGGGPGYIGSLFSDISIFKVRTITFVGCESASEQRLRQLTNVTLYKTSLLSLDEQRIAAGIRRDPWVSQVKVERDWPSGLRIEVVEHRPVAMINKLVEGKPKLYYVDRHGFPFLEVKKGNDVDFPVITGLNGRSLQDLTNLFDDISMFLRLVGNNNPNLPAQSVSEININEEGEMVVYLVDYTFPIFFGRGDVRAKYSRLVKVLGELYQEKKKGLFLSQVEYIRMDYLNDKVLVAQSESG